jgi:YVTN family beta-propeller protein
VLPRALDKDPARRYANCAELVDAARRALGIASPARSRWPLAVAALGLAVIAAALLAFFLTRSGGAPATTGTAVRLDAATGKVTDRVAVGNDPEAIAAGPDGVWVANSADGTVSKIDPGGSQVSTIRVSGLPVSLAVGEGVVLVATAPPANTLTLIRAQAGSVYDLIPLHSAAAAATSLVESGPAGIWLADKEQWTVRRVDPAGGTDFRVLAAGRLPLHNGVGEVNDLAVGRNAVWVAGNFEVRRLWRVDPRTARVVATIVLPIAPHRVAVGEGAVWVTGQIENVVLRVDPRTGRVVARIPVGRGGSGIAAAGGSVWVTNEFDGTVSRIDPRTNRIVATIPVGGSPHDLVVSGGSVWLTGSRE